MKSLLAAACSPRIGQGALRVAVVVGTVLNVINHGGDLLAGRSVSWVHLILNYFVPYCVATYSAAKNEITRCEMSKDDSIEIGGPVIPNVLKRPDQ